MATIKLENLVKELQLTQVVGGTDSSLVQGCYVSDLLSWVLAKGKEGDLWLTVMGHVNVIAVAKLKDFAAVVVCDGAPLDPEAKASALEHRVPVYTSPRPIYELVSELSQLL